MNLFTHKRNCEFLILAYIYFIILQKLVEGYLLRATQRSDIFAHILIWHLQVWKISNCD